MGCKLPVPIGKVIVLAKRCIFNFLITSILSVADHFIQIISEWLVTQSLNKARRGHMSLSIE